MEGNKLQHEDLNKFWFFLIFIFLDHLGLTTLVWDYAFILFFLL